ncbi:MAG TPA: glucose 1-dehydrogenase [Acetobacteraceae bacterium]|nr:glucose 1-dehydrogenase [Acetobacteraceae bacterium]
MSVFDLFSLKGRVALVTGASRGLGRAMAGGLAEAGATVVLAARDKSGLERAAAEIRADGGPTDIEPFELSDHAAVEAAVPAILARHGKLDILLNNGGTIEWGPLTSSTLEAWERCFDVNVTASYLLAREAAKPMVKAGWGRIINIGSYVSVIGRERLAAYVASKHAVAGLTKSIAGELGRHGVTCNAISPGFFDTDMAAPTVRDPERSEIFRRAIAMGRFGRPEEMIGAALFLASEASSYVNGHMIHVDGGVADVLSLRVAVSG